MVNERLNLVLSERKKVLTLLARKSISELIKTVLSFETSAVKAVLPVPLAEYFCSIHHFFPEKEWRVQGLKDSFYSNLL